MQPESGVKVWQWVVTVIVIIALIVIGIFVFGGKKTEAPTTGETPSASQPTQADNRIIMSDQFPGNVVYLSSVQASQPVWVAIHKDDNGKPGKIIGQAKFAAGINPGRINLSEPTIDGGTYYAMMHTDNGDATFDETKDVPLKDEKGDIIMKIFRATTSANMEIKG